MITGNPDRVEGYTYYANAYMTASGILDHLSTGMGSELSLTDNIPDPYAPGGNYKITVTVEKM